MYKNLKNKIAEGGCSEIYEWENGSKIIKLAKDNTGYEAMKREYENNFVAWKNNLPVPKPYDFVEVNG
ncbi:MAG TPA: hypothetical protein VKY40_03445, partial [Halanaerobiales bacterium]|nr:hypothetical protein [Halanaerobiales bacterium]